MNKPKKRILDTNVPKTANLAVDPASVPDELVECVSACVEVIQEVTKWGGLVLDAGDEIYDEYRQQLSMKGEPGVGDKFMKWVHNNRWSLPADDRVPITREGDSYREFPNREGLRHLDPSDRKFVAVANAHRCKPPICQATDSKWRGWKEALSEAGISVLFLCEGYVSAKYREKMEG
jgi:hypothetical protein